MPPCFTAHMQSFTVFWRRFFLSTKSKAKEFTCPWRSGGENPVTKGRLPGQWLGLERDSNGHFAFTIFVGKNLDNLSMAPWLPPQAMPAAPGCAPCPVHLRHGSQHPGDAQASVDAANPQPPKTRLLPRALRGQSTKMTHARGGRCLA